MTSIIKVDQIQTAAGATPTADGLGINVDALSALAGTILTSKTFRIPSSAYNMAINSTDIIQWFSESFTTKRANSKVLITYHSGQIACPSPPASGEYNAKLTWSIDATGSGSNMELYRDHNHEWYRAVSANTDSRIFITGQALTNSVSAGTHTIYAYAAAYNTPLTFGHQANSPNRGAIMTFQEIAG
jgi:hypothetical protein